MQKHITDEVFNEAYHTIAKIVVESGDTYLPIFERMQKEKLQRQATQDLKNLAAQIVTSLTK